jgi:hypothetical protein
MKKLLLLLSFVLPLFALSQSLDKKFSVVADLMKEGYSVASEYTMVLKKGEEKTFERTFYSNTKYVVVAIPTESGVTDSDLYIDYPDGDSYVKDNDNYAWSIVRYTKIYEQPMKIRVKNYAASSSTYSYDFTVVVMYK